MDEPSKGAGRRLLLVTTDAVSANKLMSGQLRALQTAGFTVAVAASPNHHLREVAEREGVATYGVPMLRAISPLRDVLAVARLIRATREFRPNILCASTPKAGLLGMVAARFCGVPNAVYTLRGLRLETTSGTRRRVLAAAERTAAACAHHVVCVSESLRRRALELRLVAGGKAVVLGRGSSNGVDVERYHLCAPGERRAVRESLSIACEAPVIGFVGRLTRDKGIADLAEVFFGRVVPRHPDARLLLVGDFEEGDPVPDEVRARLAESQHVTVTGLVADTSRYYAAMDVVAFPSYREGFPNVPLEAAASGLPVAGYAATGTVDAIEDGATGTLVPVADRGALAAALERYLADPALRSRHGDAGRGRAVTLFRQEHVWRSWIEFYRSLPVGGRGAQR